MNTYVYIYIYICMFLPARVLEPCNQNLHLLTVFSLCRSGGRRPLTAAVCLALKLFAFCWPHFLPFLGVEFQAEARTYLDLPMWFLFGFVWFVVGISGIKLKRKYIERSR